MERLNISSGREWEAIVGYSRAVKFGNFISVAGTTATDDQGNIVGINNPYEQTKQALKNIEQALIKCNASYTDIIRTRLFVTDISRWEEYGRAHGEIFRDIRPVTTMVEVSKLINPDMMVEIEAEAILNTLS